jgi:hypothetical protein
MLHWLKEESKGQRKTKGYLQSIRVDVWQRRERRVGGRKRRFELFNSRFKLSNVEKICLPKGRKTTEGQQ